MYIQRLGPKERVPSASTKDVILLLRLHMVITMAGHLPLREGLLALCSERAFHDAVAAYLSWNQPASLIFQHRLSQDSLWVRNTLSHGEERRLSFLARGFAHEEVSMRKLRSRRRRVVGMEEERGKRWMADGKLELSLPSFDGLDKRGEMWLGTLLVVLSPVDSRTM